MTYKLGFSNMDYVCPVLVEGVSQYETVPIPANVDLEAIQQQEQEKKFPWWLLLLVGGVAYYSSRGDAL